MLPLYILNSIVWGVITFLDAIFSRLELETLLTELPVLDNSELSVSESARGSVDRHIGQSVVPRPQTRVYGAFNA